MITFIVSLTYAANDTSRREDPVVDLNRKPYVPYPIDLSVILKAYNVYPFAHSDGVKLMLLSPVSPIQAPGETSSKPLNTARSRNLGYSLRAAPMCHCATSRCG